jgi:hypothetical protein
MPSKAEQLIKRYDTLKTAQANWRTTWQELADYILPSRKNILSKRTPGVKQTEKLFDSTAPDSAVKLASFIAGSLSNMSIQWFSLKMRSEDLNDDKDVAEWLDQCSRIIYRSLKQSNFNTESQELYLDLAVFALGALLVDEKEDGGYLFRAEAIGSYVIVENAEGMVDTIFRRVEMPLCAAAYKWGKENLSEKSQEKLLKNPDEMLEIIHAVMPRHTAPNGRMKQNKPFASYYIEYEKKKIIDEGGYDEMPFMVVRWSKSAGETEGRGPGFTALPDIKTLNKADELTLRGWAKIIAPPLKVREDGVIGRVKTQPEALTVVRDMDALMPMEQGGKWDVNAALTADRRNSIRRYFYADQLQLPDKTIITATEVDRRIELMQQILGPTTGRFEYELFNPLVSRLFKIKMRRKELPPVPSKVLEYAKQNHVEIDVEYEGPLSRAQRGGELMAFNKLLAGAMGILQVNPQSRIMDNLDDDAAYKFLVDVTGSPKKLSRPDKDRDGIREQAAQAVEQAQAQQNANMAADTTQKVASANTDLTAAQQPQEASPFGTPAQAA